MGQNAHMIAVCGLERKDFTIIPADQVDRRFRIQKSKAFLGRKKGHSPYSANAFLDTGANVLVTGVRELFPQLEEMETRVEGLGETVFTHTGPVTMVIGTQTVTLKGYWKKGFAGTIVPGNDFDDGQWWFQSKDRVLHLCKGATVHGKYPRELTVDEDLPHPHDFLTSLGPSVNGVRQSSMFPMPDTCFVWHVPSANVIKSVPRTDKKTAAPVPIVDTSSGAELYESGNPNAELVFVSAVPDDQKESRKRKILGAIQKLRHWHHISGNRSSEQTALQYEWVTGQRLPQEAIDNQRACMACDASNITSDSYRKTRLIKVSEAGEVLAADTIVGLPRSHNGYRHIGHFKDEATDYGDAYNSRTKALGGQFLFWIKWMANTTGRHPVRIKVDSGEFLTTALTDYYEVH